MAGTTDGTVSPTPTAEKTAEGNTVSPAQIAEKAAEEGIVSTTQTAEKAAEEGTVSPTQTAEKVAEGNTASPLQTAEKATEEDTVSPSQTAEKVAEEGTVSPTQTAEKVAEGNTASPLQTAEKAAEENTVSTTKTAEKAAEEGTVTPAQTAEKKAVGDGTLNKKQTTKKGAKASEAVDNHDGLTGWQLMRQVFVGLMVAMITVSSSASAMTAVMLPRLATNTSEIPVTTQQGTWLASAHSFSAAVSSTLGGMAVHHLGPRRVLLLEALPAIAGCMMMALATNYPLLLTGRCLVGACAGISLSAGQVFLGEASSPQIRGRLVCIIGVCNGLGTLTSYVVGYLLPWRWVPAAPVILFLLPSTLGMLFVPESPYWLLGRQKHERARRSLRSLRGDPAVAERDLEVIAEACKSRQKGLTLRELGGELRKLPVLAPFLTITALFTVRTFTGIAAVLTYLVEIVQETGSPIDPFQSAILFGCVRTLTSLSCALYVSDRFGRRPLLMFSGVGCTLTTLGMAAFLFCRDRAPLWTGWQHISWLPLPLILLYIVAFDYGFGRTGWVVHAEIFPNRVRSALSGFGVLFHYIGAAVGIMFFSYLRETFSLASAFCSFAVSSFLGLLLTIFFIPETKNQRLETIEAFYVQRFGAHRKEVVN